MCPRRSGMPDTLSDSTTPPDLPLAPPPRCPAYSTLRARARRGGGWPTPAGHWRATSPFLPLFLLLPHPPLRTSPHSPISSSCALLHRPPPRCLLLHLERRARPREPYAQSMSPWCIGEPCSGSSRLQSPSPMSTGEAGRQERGRGSYGQGGREDEEEEMARGEEAAPGGGSRRAIEQSKGQDEGTDDEAGEEVR